MEWPATCDVQRALRNPAVAFTDPELRGGTLPTDQYGFATTHVGARADVWAFDVGAKKLALRTFRHPDHSQVERLTKVALYLAAAQPAGVVPMQVQPEGLRIDGKAYPLVKMPWIEGLHLDAYISSQRNAPDKLLRVAQEIEQLIAQLHAQGVYHGDLHHGNVLVTPNKGVVLVDCDAMVVPGLQANATEWGHPDYNHPLREGAGSPEAADRFAAWLMSASLRALACDFTLRKPFGDLDEPRTPLLAQADLVSPNTSPHFALLLLHAHPTVRSLGLLLQSLLAMKPTDIPSVRLLSQMAPRRLAS